MNRRRQGTAAGGRKGGPGGGFSGITKFTQLSDCPAAYTGSASKFVTVKAGENGLEFTPLPPLAITDTFVVISQAAMLALTAQTGDVAVRTDINQTFILQGTDPSILANWVLLLISPTHALAGALHTADTITNLKTKISAPDILITSQAAEISTLTNKATPTGSDLLIIEDAADTNKKKKILISTLPAPTTVFPEFQYFADQFKTPVTTEYPKDGSGAALLQVDSNNNSLVNRAMNDSEDQGIAWDLIIPAGATNIIFDVMHRAETAPSVSKGVTAAIYTRQITDNTTVPSWSAEYELNPWTVPASELWQLDTQTITLVSMGLTAGLLTNFEFVRDLFEASSNLVGDWNILFIRVRFS